MHELSITQLQSALREKQFSAEELTQHYLQRIKFSNPNLNCFITITEDQALAQARAADDLFAQGKAQALTGIPIAHKDIFCTKGVRTSCASRMLDNFIAPYDASIIKRFNQAGAVMLGKTNMDEFAMGASNETSYYGSVKNPWALHHVPGGSSGGSAAAVAARLCAGATGTDTGGSIRQPSSFCGLTGLRPTYGRVSRFGMVAFASSLDQAGPMARDAADCAILMQSLAGFDEHDSTSVDHPVADYSKVLNDDLTDLTIGIPEEFIGADLDPAIASLLTAVQEQFKQLNVKFKKVNLANAHFAVPCYYVLAPSEASANLSRYDGVRFGYRCDAPENLTDLYKRSRSEAFGAEVKRRIMIGTHALSAGYYDAYYLKAQKVRRLISNDFQAAFKEVDMILTPTTPETAFPIGGKIKDPIKMFLCDKFTTPVNLAGLNAISAPMGFIDNLPIGFQLIGNYFQEAKLLNAVHRYQQVTDWHTKVAEEA